MTKTNVQSTPSDSQHHDTPNNKTHVIKFRVTAEEKASLELTCKLLNLSLSTFIRRAIHNVKIEKTVIVAGGGEETLTTVSTLLAQCSKVGTNLNQLARHRYIKSCRRMKSSACWGRRPGTFCIVA